MNLPPGYTDRDYLEPYRGYLVNKEIEESQNADTVAKQARAANTLATIQYFNATAFRKHVLAPYIRRHFRYLEHPTYIDIPGVREPILFQAGSVVDANAHDIMARAKMASGRFEPNNARPAPALWRELMSVDDLSDEHQFTVYEDFCVLPRLHRAKNKQRGGVKLPNLIYITLGEERHNERKRYKLHFGWMVMILRHPDIPASAPLVYGLIDQSRSAFRENPRAPVRWDHDYSSKNPVLVPNKWAPENLVLQRVEPSATYERRAHDFIVYKHNDLVSVNRDYWEHPFSDEDQNTLYSMLHCDILDHDEVYRVSNDDIAEIRLDGCPVEHSSGYR